MLITRLLNRLVQDVQQTKKSYFTQAERACTSALQDIRGTNSDEDNENKNKIVKRKSVEYEHHEDGLDTSANMDLLVGEELRPQVSVDSEKFFIPFELACKGDSAKITITALDGIQKLIAYGELIGDYPDPKTPSRRLIDRIVETICNCHMEHELDEGVELQIIKALLTVVTSEHVQVHESTLLLILRTCCIMFLTTKSPVNQRTARAMLTQMLHSIFHRMEIAAEEVESQKKNCYNKTNAEASIFQEWEAECVALAGECFSHSILSVPTTIFPTTFCQTTIQDNIHGDINQNSEGYADKAQNSDPESFTNQENLDSTTGDDTNSTNPFLNATNKTVCYSASESGPVGVLKRDAFLSFWTLAKLALKPLKPESEDETVKTGPESKYQQAILAFHLLKEVLERSGKVFQESPIFINAMKQHLCFAVLENGVSPNSELFTLEVDVIMILITKFKQVLIEEVQQLLENIIFPVLQSSTNPSSNPHQADYRKIVLRSLKSISSNLDCFVHLYRTYDYDVTKESKLFHLTSSCLTRTICDRLGNEDLAIEIITNLLKSMSEACPKLEDNRLDAELESGRFSSFESTNESLQFEDSRVQNLELEGKDFLTSLHVFLANVDVSWDVFKIDWCVQKLAQIMTDTSSVNSLRTETADCWYSLVYSSMSLIADIKITNCQGKSKMSKSQFIKLNRGINGCDPLDETFLSSIYDEIEDNYKRDTGYHPPSKWLKIAERSEKEILDAIKFILEATSLLRSHFSLGRQLKHVKRMIKVCGPLFLTALINALQSTNDTKLSDVCLEGLHSGIRVACILELDNEREAFVQALGKLAISALDEIRGKHINSKIVTKSTSTLTMTENGVTKTVVTTTTEMKCRSVDIILTLLDVGVAEGNHLGGSWLHILKFISQLLSTSLLGESRNSSRSNSPVQPIQQNVASGTSSTSGSGWAAWAGSLKESLEKKIWDPAGTVLYPSVKESIANAVEKVFKRSEMLTGDAMTDFFQALCQVALHDMMNSETPRHLMYEKINEVADGNFYRPALQWSQIWQVVADYFCHLACSSKGEISTLAIDSIEKLVLKLLKKETLNGYRFQNHYFSPFQVIITNTRSHTTRDAVLGFVETVISLYGDLLLSGWIAILSILVSNMLSHNDKDAGADSFRLLQHIVDKCLKGEVNLRNSFGSIIKYLINVAGNIAPTLEVSEQAFGLLTQMAKIPHQQPQLLMEENDDRRYRVWSRGWKPIFCELSEIIRTKNDTDSTNATNENKMVNGNSSWDIKTKALITLFEVIKSYGSSFEKEWWNSVFETLFHIFNNIKSQEKQDLMFAIFDVYIQYYEATADYVFDELLKHLQWCICQDHEQIALSGVSCLQQLVTALGKRFTVKQWDSILVVFQTISKPLDLSHSSKQYYTSNVDDTRKSSKIDTEIHQAPAIRAIIHLELLKIMDKVIFNGERASAPNSVNENEEVTSVAVDSGYASIGEINPKLTSEQISTILEILNRSYEVAKEHCVIISWSKAEKDEEQNLGDKNYFAATPNFIPHETLSLHIYWKTLYAMFNSDSTTKHGITKDTLWNTIQQSSIRSCGYFVTLQLREHRDAWTDLLCFSLSNILQLPKSNFRSMTSELYPYFCEMLEMDLLHTKICEKLREYFIVIGEDYGVLPLCEANKGERQFGDKNQTNQREQSQSAFCNSDDSSCHSILKSCNGGAHIQFQNDSLTETFHNRTIHYQ